MLPQRLLGRDLFWWLTRLGILRIRGDSRLGRRVQARGEVATGTDRRTLRRTGITLRTRLVDAAGPTARFADGTDLAVGVVIWATGYRSDYSWIDLPDVVRGSEVLHRRGVTDVPGLFFLGLAWQHTRGSALLGFVHADVAYIADRIDANSALRYASHPVAAR
jgi:putative flavoprotein involved in K+ transport